MALRLSLAVLIVLLCVLRHTNACSRSGGGGGSSGSSRSYQSSSHNSYYDSRDSRCQRKGGVCKDDSFYCHGSNGYYSKGLCGGPDDRRCCIRAPMLEPGDCSRSSQISRWQWGAESPRSRSRIPGQMKYVFIHHTAGRRCHSESECIDTVKDVQHDHMHDREERWQDIGYNWLVGEDGRAYEGRNWLYEGSHTYGYNRRGVAVSVMGNFDRDVPNEEALQAVLDIIACGIDNGAISREYELFGHVDASLIKKCPGETFYSLIKTWPRFLGNRIRKW